MKSFFNRILSITKPVKYVIITPALVLAYAAMSDNNRTYTLNEKSIVKVLSLDGKGGGTGWVARDKDANKVIITNDHVCDVTLGGFVRVEAEDGTPYIKGILERNFERDLCIVEGIDAPALTIAKKGPSKLDKVRVLGHPGLRPTAPAYGVYTGMGIVKIGFSPVGGECPRTTEIVDGLFGQFCVLNMELGYTTVPVLPGNSGSPITNEDGEVIGVVNSAESVGNQGMFIPLTYLNQMLNGT